ncbi:MAG: hypothetical protein VX373_02895 [Pseudomonadota bacterium]|nr:hypothetical protein [Pseudomonadota bacterium]
MQVEGAALGEDPTRPWAAQPDDRQMITHLSDAGVVSGEGAGEPVGGGGELIQSGDHQKLIGTQPGGGHVVTRDKPIGGRRRPIQGPDRGRIDTQIQQTKTAFHGQHQAGVGRAADGREQRVQGTGGAGIIRQGALPPGQRIAGR